MAELQARSDGALGSELVQLHEPGMAKIGPTKQDPPLDELVDKLTTLLMQSSKPDGPESASLLQAPLEAAPSDSPQPQIDRAAERELLVNMMQTLNRVEAAQDHVVADLRREIAQTFGQLVLSLERAGELSDSSIQKLQVALGVAARESFERRILNDFFLLRDALQRQDEDPTEPQKGIGGRIVVALGLGVILFVAGVVAGTLAAPRIAPWLSGILGLVF